jgi:hypothetical protein
VSLHTRKFENAEKNGQKIAVIFFEQILWLLQLFAVNYGPMGPKSDTRHNFEPKGNNAL